MTVTPGGSDAVAEGGQMIAALYRAVLAAGRAARELALAERHDRLAAEGSKRNTAWHTELADRHRSTAHCHITASRLQYSFADGVVSWFSNRESRRPLFMSGVADACGTRSAALTLLGADLTQLAVAASDVRSGEAQDLEYILSEGPALDAARSGRRVSASGTAIERRWPSYGCGLSELGIDSVIALPLTVSSSCIGALTLFDPPLRAAERDSGSFREVAEALAKSILLGPEADPDLYGNTDHRATVHQAAGSLSIQAGCTVTDALDLIKARAFSEGKPSAEVARRVLSGELKLN
ncbi:GAF and ANTAR domain-containing protein [Streptomyces sp. NPDC059009]|uniref:GAF and ANTAR domain-containing protein n=1 Tax=Streptomyces sp. NPDC059009 TaxID=3346694 RepID=UPI00367AFD43